MKKTLLALTLFLSISYNLVSQENNVPSVDFLEMAIKYNFSTIHDYATGAIIDVDEHLDQTNYESIKTITTVDAPTWVNKVEHYKDGKIQKVEKSRYNLEYEYDDSGTLVASAMVSHEGVVWAPFTYKYFNTYDKNEIILESYKSEELFSTTTVSITNSGYTVTQNIATGPIDIFEYVYKDGLLKSRVRYNEKDEEIERVDCYYEDGILVRYEATKVVETNLIITLTTEFTYKDSLLVELERRLTNSATPSTVKIVFSNFDEQGNYLTKHISNSAMGTTIIDRIIEYY